MAIVTGPLNAGLSAALAGTGGDTKGGTGYASGGQWTNPANGAVADGQMATATLSANLIVTDTLKASNFGVAIPTNAVISGIMVEYTWSATNSFTYSISLNRGTSKQSGHIVGGQWWAWGGVNDLWGTTWTAADVNSNTLASLFSVTTTVAGNVIQVDGVRITVYWDYPPLAAGTIQKQHQYQVYRQGRYLGLLPRPTSEFAYSQDINTAGSQITINCPLSGDIAGLDTPTIDDEQGNPILTESGQALQVEKYPDVIGNGNSNGLYQNGNQIIVTEISNYHPNGIVVFSGDIERWATTFGGVDGDQITLTVYSDGAELNNYLMSGGDTLDQSQTSQNRTIAIFEASNTWYRVGQSFTIGTGVTTLDAFSFFYQDFNYQEAFTVRIYSSIAAANAGTPPLAQTTVNAGYAGTSPAEAKAVLSPVLKVTPGQTFFATIQAAHADGVNTNIYYQNTDVYAGGGMQVNGYSGGSGATWVSPGNYDLMFKTYSGGASTSITYSTSDPTNILIDAVNRYNAKGGVIKVANGSTDLTGRSVTYPFSIATLFEGISKCLELAPYNWYWYVDIGTDTLYFKQYATTPKYIFIKGRHFSSLNLSATTENVKNVLYFTGGTPSGNTTNLFSIYSDAPSIAANKQRLDRQTDNRVTLQSTADALGTNFIAASKNENYETSITILDSMMDISLFKVGDTVGFAGTGLFVDNLLLQIARIDYTPSQAVLTLGELPPRFNQTLRDIQKELTDLQTLANPSTPS